MIRLFAALPLLIVAGCTGDETLVKYGAAGKSWVLEEIDGAPFGARAEIEFKGQEEVTGQAPCNRYGARQAAPYPWFKLEAIVATKMACAQLQQEQVYFEALGAMTLAEVGSETLILSNDAGRTMVFKAR